MSLKDILLGGAAHITLNDRFTSLRIQNTSQTAQTVHFQSVRQVSFDDQQASSRSVNLANMVDRRPTIVATSQLKKHHERQWLGQRPGLSVHDRLNLHDRRALCVRVWSKSGSVNSRPGRFISDSDDRSSLSGQGPSIGISPLNRIGRNEQRVRENLSKRQGLSQIERMQFLSGKRNNIGNTRAKGKGNRRFQNRNNSFKNTETRKRWGGGASNFRFRKNGFIKNRDFRRSRRNNNYSHSSNRGPRTLGFRGQWRGRGGRPEDKGNKIPSKEELDNQLDQYMAESQSVVGRELGFKMEQGESGV